MEAIIYGLVDPGSGEVKYVGKTVDIHRRVRGHISLARRSRRTDSLTRWLREVEVPAVRILEELESEENWQEREQFWMGQFDGLLNVHSGSPGKTSSSFDLDFYKE